MGRWCWINLSEARTINIGTNKQQSKSIGMHGGAPSVLEDGSGMAGRRQKKAVQCGQDDSLMW
jgi:hypothetical protein